MKMVQTGFALLIVSGIVANGAHAGNFQLMKPAKPANATLVQDPKSKSSSGCEVKWGTARCPAGCTFVSGRCVKG
jgi:hypothetical protein